MSSHAATKIDQKEYLKRYLSGDKVKKKKKDKKHKKNVAGSTVKIIDDDVVETNGPEIDEELLLTGEDAPQIVGEYIELNPERTNPAKKWKSFVIKDEPDDDAADSPSVKAEDDLWGKKAADYHKIKDEFSHSRDGRKHKQKAASPKRKAAASPARRKRSKSASPQRRYRKNSNDRSQSPRRHNKRSLSRADSSLAVRIKQEPASDSDQSPRRQQRSRRSSDRSPATRTTQNYNQSPARSGRRNSDQSPPRRKRRDSDQSAARRGRKNSDQSPPRRNRRDSDQSAARRGSKNSDQTPPRRNRRDSDQSPPRKNKRDSNQSPPRRNRRDSDQSPPRRNQRTKSPVRRNGKDNDLSPARILRRDSDNSPPRRQRTNAISPMRKIKTERNADQSPARRKRRDSNQSPTRRNRKNSDQSPPRRNRQTSDQSPPRRIKQEKDCSPARIKQEPASSTVLNRKSRWARASPSKSVSPPPTHAGKSKTTLDGKKAGLQDARSLQHETNERRRQEDLLYEQMSSDISGRNAEVRVRSTGRRGQRARDAEAEDPVERRRKEEREEQKKLLYDRWGKGLKQLEAHEQRRAEQQHEASKPLARYANDDDLDRHLREQEHADDPMLAYIRAKKKEREKHKPSMPVYEGSFPENRFGIRPGYRWDGVDRSNGFEKKWFDMKNEQRAVQDEAYKYSVEDM